MEIELFEGGFGLEAVDTRARSRWQGDSEERASSKTGDLFLEVDGAIDVG